MYSNYPTAGSPPLPDIIGQYYSPSYGITGSLPPYDFYGIPAASAGYLYEPTTGIAGLYGHTSPVRRRRYSIAGLPSASMMNDYYGYGMPAMGPSLHQSSSSNILNLLNEAHKSISRSSQILSQHARIQQAQQTVGQPVTPLSAHYPGRVISSYPTLHPGDTSPPYLNDNLMQMSANFSSQPNMYFQQYTQPPPPPPPPAPGGGLGMGIVGSRLKPAYSVSNLNYLNYPSGITGLGGSKYITGGVPSSSYANAYTQTLLNPSDPYNYSNLLQQRNLMSSLHASNPTVSQLYQPPPQPPPPSSSHYTQQQAHQQALAYNIQQQFAGAQHYAHQLPSSTHPQAHIHTSVQQQLNPDHQFHVHQQQNHLQTHPLAALASTTAPFPATLTSSALHDARSAIGSTAGLTGSSGGAAAAYDLLIHPSSSYPTSQPLHHHLHQHHQHYTPHNLHATHTPHMQPPHVTTTSSYHHMPPYTKIDLDYPKLPQEHKRQVSFKFDVDTLSLDS